MTANPTFEEICVLLERVQSEPPLTELEQELLSALKELNDAILDGLCNEGIPGFDPDRLDRAMSAATALVAKAEGKRP